MPIIIGWYIGKFIGRMIVNIITLLIHLLRLSLVAAKHFVKYAFLFLDWFTGLLWMGSKRVYEHYYVNLR